MKKISKEFGFDYKINHKNWKITAWEKSEKGIKVYSNGVYKGTILKKSEDYSQVKNDLISMSVTEAQKEMI